MSNFFLPAGHRQAFDPKMNRTLPSFIPLSPIIPEGPRSVGAFGRLKELPSERTAAPFCILPHVILLNGQRQQVQGPRQVLP